jgi:polyhydroxybutyrate depolymerase
MSMSGAASGGTGGTSGGGSAGAGSGGTTEIQKSEGCGTAATQTLNQWVDSMVMTGGANRPYAVRLPTGYDAMRAYPVVVLLHGCGSGTNNVPMEKATGADAILVRGTGSGADTCWNTSANGPDVAFFDAMVTDVKKRFCADEHRFFVVGYSSGSWLVNQLTCIRASVLRGGASVTGGESASGNCGGPVARIFIHDEGDDTNQISGSIRARDRHLTQNMCDESAQPTPVDPSPCTLYQGCAAGNPVEWCQTMGEMHNRQDSFAPTTFWNFFKAL